MLSMLLLEEKGTKGNRISCTSRLHRYKLLHLCDPLLGEFFVRKPLGRNPSPLPYLQGLFYGERLLKASGEFGRCCGVEP